MGHAHGSTEQQVADPLSACSTLEIRTDRAKAINVRAMGETLTRIPSDGSVKPVLA